jgi:hypothetical protein
MQSLRQELTPLPKGKQHRSVADDQAHEGRSEVGQGALPGADHEGPATLTVAMALMMDQDDMRAAALGWTKAERQVWSARARPDGGTSTPRPRPRPGGAKHEQ